MEAEGLMIVRRRHLIEPTIAGVSIIMSNDKAFREVRYNTHKGPLQ